MKKQNKKQKLGLVLEGGGAKGSYHLGAYKALVEEDLIPNAVVGTSIGALNGALIAQGDWEIMYDVWYYMSITKILDIDPDQIENLQQNRFSLESFKYFAQYLHQSFEEDGLDTTRIRTLLKTIVDEEKIRQSPMNFGLVTVSLSDRKPVQLFVKDIPTGKLIKYLMASSNFPIFKREVIDGKKFIDGGMYDNSPVQLLKEINPQKVIIVRTHGLGIYRPTKMENIEQIEINPVEDLGGMLDFSQENCRYNLQLGYYDTLKVLRNLFGREYYFQPTYSDSLLINQMLEISVPFIRELADTLNISSDYSHPRILFEKILPTLANMMNLEPSATYEEILGIACEEAAKTIKLERFKIYTLEEMIREIKKKSKKTPKSTLKKWFSFPLGNEIFLKAFKSQIVEEIVLEMIHLPDSTPLRRI